MEKKIHAKIETKHLAQLSLFVRLSIHCDLLLLVEACVAMPHFACCCAVATTHLMRGLLLWRTGALPWLPAVATGAWPSSTIYYQYCLPVAPA